MNFDSAGVVALLIAAVVYLGWRVYSTLASRKRAQSTCPGCGTCEGANVEAKKRTGELA
ncbi:MAG: hypothetical protein QGG73_04830 [Candidatus Hydrogenedentes bacterium]|jgi:hypothetical protein|nr:hypothetical protein [Candidatus Hydrogenedentota bacterium]